MNDRNLGLSPNRRALMSFVVLLLVYLLGTRLPIPGLVPATLTDSGAFGLPTAALSIAALGILPFFTVLVHWQIVRLIFPGLDAWQAGSQRNAHRLWLALCLLALLIAGIQAYGILIALIETGLAAGDSAAFVPVGVLSLVAATALLIWLGEKFRIGQVGSGMWALLTAPFLLGLPGDLAATAELARYGAITPLSLLMTGVLLAGAAGLVVFARTILTRGLPQQNPRAPTAVSILLWPPFMAATAAGYALIPFALLATDGTALGWLPTLAVVFTSILMPVFTFSFAWRWTQLNAARWTDIRPVAAVVSAIQIVICAGPYVLDRTIALPVSLNGGILIALIAILLELARRPAPQD